MERILMQIYTIGSVEAFALYKEAFDGIPGTVVKHPDGTYYHSELDIGGYVVAVAERKEDLRPEISGNTMQFCLQFGSQGEAKLKKAYDLLKVDAQILTPIGSSDYSPLMTDLVDRFGVRWCLFL